MNRSPIFFIIIIFGLISCNGNSLEKVVERWPNGNKKISHIYFDNIDTCCYNEIQYYKNGKIQQRSETYFGNYAGNMVWYYENGNKRDSAYIRHGKYIKNRTHWYENGILKQVETIDGECDYECCNGKVVNYYPNGKMQDEFYNLNGQRNGLYRYYYDNGQVKKQEYFKNGVKDGSYNEWFENGKPWVVGAYKNGNQDSTWVFWNEKDTIDEIDVYKKGKFIKTRL